MKGYHLAVLHNVKLPKPRLIKRITRSVDDMTKSILLGDDQHRVQKTLHCIR
jgi:hypothetical protein